MTEHLVGRRMQGLRRMRAFTTFLVASILADPPWFNVIAANLTVSRDRHRSRFDPRLPYFMGGRPQHQVHEYAPDVKRSRHHVHGDEISRASTGTSASFLIRLAPGSNGADEIPSPWNVSPLRFFYVWIAGEDQILTAEVVNNQNGTLTATYLSNFPGEYLVYVEEITFLRKKYRKAKPFNGSPFKLTISGQPTITPRVLPTCDTELWQPGSWISSNVASAEHGVLRNGWVFQPEHCVYETFSFDDLMLIAALNEPTWLLVLGNSVQRGLMLTLLDMVLSRGQKDKFAKSAPEKCWGWSDIHVGNLRISYQDMRLKSFSSEEDVIVCHNSKLASGGSAAYVSAADQFLRNYIFREGSHWPDVIVSSGYLTTDMRRGNLSVKVPIGALPPDWGGKILFVEHLSAWGFYWDFANPTMKSLDEVKPTLTGSSSEVDLAILVREYDSQDPRVKFMSSFPISQAVLWENEYMKSKKGLCYGCSQHYHFITHANDDRSYGGSILVHSMVTEMLMNIIMSEAVGTKEVLYERAASVEGLGHKISTVRRSPFEVCIDCPLELLPFHVKPEPKPSCKKSMSLEVDKDAHTVWDSGLCPEWCMATEPVSRIPTESDPVDVRECKSRASLP